MKKVSDTTTAVNSEVILEYARYGKFGLSKVTEVIDISNKSERALRKIISALFHFLKNTEATKNHDKGVTATFCTDGKKLFYIFQKANDFEEQRFSLVGYKPDESEKRLRKISYDDTRIFILKAFGFLCEKNSEESEEEEIESGAAVVDDDAGFDECE